MILIDCPTCRRQVPEKARTCRGCGKPLPREGVPWIRKHLLPNVVVLVLGASFVGWTGDPFDITHYPKAVWAEGTPVYNA